MSLKLRPEYGYREFNDKELVHDDKWTEMALWSLWTPLIMNTHWLRDSDELWKGGWNGWREKDCHFLIMMLLLFLAYWSGILIKRIRCNVWWYALGANDRGRRRLWKDSERERQRQRQRQTETYEVALRRGNNNWERNKVKKRPSILA